MSEADAAEYVGVSLRQFRYERDRGLWPKPKNRGARINTYDRNELDDAVDRLGGAVNDPEGIDLDKEIFSLGTGTNSISR